MSVPGQSPRYPAGMARPPRGKRQTDADGTVTVRSKAANGAGSVFYDAGKARWRCRFVDATGRQRTVLGRTRAEAEARRDAALNTRPVAATATVAEVAAEWLRDVAAVTVRPGTLGAYKKDVGHVVDHLGDLPVADLDGAAVRQFLASMVDAGFAVGTIRNARARLRQVADFAVQTGRLAGNPVGAAPLPRETAERRSVKRALSPGEVQLLVGACDGSRPLDAAVAILFLHGWRASEVLGLAWSDVDLGAGTAHVTRASTYLPGTGMVLDKPKTRSTAGVHLLSPTVARLLVLRLAQQAADRAAAAESWQRTTYEALPLELVFTTPVGAPTLRQALYGHVRTRAADAGLDVERLGTHAGRRSVVTSLYQAGLPLEDVARHVGHASTSTTAGYVIDLGNRPAETARRAAALLDPMAGPS